MAGQSWWRGLLGSRKFWLAVVGVAQTVLFNLVPGFPKEVWVAINVLIGVLIGFVYIFSAKLMSVSAIHAGVPPGVAAWTPNVLFGLLGGWLYRRAPK